MAAVKQMIMISVSRACWAHIIITRILLPKSVAFMGAWLLLSCAMTCRVSATTFVIGNNCGYTVWPGILSNAGVPLLANGGFTLQPGQSSTLDAPSGWSGRLWGRTGCNFTSDGVGTCSSGDCGGKLECEGIGGTPPTTLVEFTLKGTAGATEDFYDVSLVDGYNVPVTVTPTNNGSGACGIAGCSADINTNCPSSLQVVDDGEVVSCKSACLAFQSAQYCCDGAYASPTTCTPTTYSEFFKSACPNAYSYAYDDPTSIFTCSSSQYLITFCPSSTTTTNSSQKTSSGIVSNSTGGTTISSSNSWSGSSNNTPIITRVNMLICVIMGLLHWKV
eukprot:c16753_g1_i1 orf=723-1721(-)